MESNNNELPMERHWAAEFSKFEIHPDDDIEKDLSLVKFHQSERDVDVCTKGNFSAIVGMMKSRKSYFMSMLISAFARGGVLYDKFMTDATDGKAVLFDTEQGRFHLLQKLRAIETMAKTFDRIRAYFMRTLEVSERIEFIEEYLKEYGDEISLVVIDGIRDLVRDINSTEEATSVAQLLMRWTHDYDIHIIVVIHQNKGDGYAKGHIGSEIMAKAETVIKAENEGGQTKISCDYSRDMPFSPFRIGIENGIPYITEDSLSAAEENF